MWPNQLHNRFPSIIPIMGLLWSTTPFPWCRKITFCTYAIKKEFAFFGTKILIRRAQGIFTLHMKWSTVSLLLSLWVEFALNLSWVWIDRKSDITDLVGPEDRDTKTVFMPTRVGGLLQEMKESEDRCSLLYFCIIALLNNAFNNETFSFIFMPPFSTHISGLLHE